MQQRFPASIWELLVKLEFITEVTTAAVEDPDGIGKGFLLVAAGEVENLSKLSLRRLRREDEKMDRMCLSK